MHIPGHGEEDPRLRIDHGVYRVQVQCHVTHVSGLSLLPWFSTEVAPSAQIVVVKLHRRTLIYYVLS